MRETLPSPELPFRCELQHKLFSTMGDVRFRRSTTDGVPMMALMLGDREAHLPLDSLRREFCIEKDSADGRMLDLIGSALDFVPSLQPGDQLPAEIRTGEASWQPSPNNIRLAATRLRLDLVSWVSPASRWAKAGRDELTLLRLADDPALRAEVEAACLPVAGQLGLRDRADVIRLMDDLSQELACIEALRERLLGRVSGLCRRVRRLLHDRKRPSLSFDTLSQVDRLAGAALKQIVSRFEDVDAQTGEIGSLLRNVDNQRVFIRTNRDWLYRTQIAWEPVLDRWCRAAEMPTEEMGAMLAATYQFLAQRCMPGTAWQRPRQQRKAGQASRMAW